MRAAAVDALVAIVEADAESPPRADDVAAGVRALLTDPAVEVRTPAIAAAGALDDREAIPALIARPSSPSRGSRRRWPWPRCPTSARLQVYLRGLTDKNTELRKASATAIANIRDQAAPVLDQLADAQRAVAGGRARAAIDLTPAWRPSPPGRSRPVPDRRGSGDSPEQADRPVGQLRGCGRASA